MNYEEQKRWLQTRGFIVGERDPLMNTDVTGNFMVSDSYPAGYTQKHGADADELWCLVGHSLPELVAGAFEQFHDGSQYIDPELPKFTVWVSESVAEGAYCIETYEAADVEAAKEAALADCAIQWDMDVEDLTILGVVAGDVKVLYWNETAA